MIKIALKDGSILEIEKETSVFDVAKKISEGLARVATCATVNGEIKAGNRCWVNCRVSTGMSV